MISEHTLYAAVAGKKGLKLEDQGLGFKGLPVPPCTRLASPHLGLSPCLLLTRVSVTSQLTVLSLPGVSRPWSRLTGVCEAHAATRAAGRLITPRVQVPNKHILTQNLYYNYYDPKRKYLIIGYMDHLGKKPSARLGPQAPQY